MTDVRTEVDITGQEVVIGNHVGQKSNRWHGAQNTLLAKGDK